jgi:hypothetical protein
VEFEECKPAEEPGDECYNHSWMNVYEACSCKERSGT